MRRFSCIAEATAASAAPHPSTGREPLPDRPWHRPVVIAVLAAGLAAADDLRLPAIFGDHMVLQQEARLPVWGKAAPGSLVTVEIGSQSVSATAGADGRWRVDLAPLPNAMAATTMTVRAGTALVFHDVVAGDVWLASGQSNMAVELSYAHNGREAAAKAKDDLLRLFVVARKTAVQPLDEVFSPFSWMPWDGKRPRESDGDHPGTWIICDQHAASSFSALAYFFARDLRTHLQRPIGVIGSYWPGCPAESFVSVPGLQLDPPFTTYLDAQRKNAAAVSEHGAEYAKACVDYRTALAEYETANSAAMARYQEAMKEWQASAKQDPGKTSAAKPTPPAIPRPKPPTAIDGGSSGPGNLFNAMLAPLIPFAIKGAIWYQGESNTRAKAPEYGILFRRLISDWRRAWGQGDFPFLYVQISHFAYAGDQSSALVREAQLQTLEVPNTGMAVTVDIPCDDAGHPHDKMDPAIRLALVARHVAYGEAVACSGPLYDSQYLDGAAIRIRFREVGGGLRIGTTPYQPPGPPEHPIPPLPTDRLVGFLIAGADRKFAAADAVIDGSEIVVSSPSVPHPVAVRFAWGDTVTCNLYNREGLPASPFRTDTWDDFTFRDLAPGVTPPTFGRR